MGSGSSRPRQEEEEDDDEDETSSSHSLPLQVGRPIGIPTRPLQNELTRGVVIQAFRNMAAFIHSHREEVTLVAVGEVINLLLLNNKDTIHTVEFFDFNLENEQLAYDSDPGESSRSAARRSDSNHSQENLLDLTRPKPRCKLWLGLVSHGAQRAASRSKPPMRRGWLSNSVQLTIPPSQSDALTRRAHEQSEAIFRDRGLTVLAAPWDFVIATCVGRASPSVYSRPYNAEDAAVYLHRYIRAHGGKPVPARQVLRWSHDYGTHMDAYALNQVEQGYFKRYQSKGIVYER